MRGPADEAGGRDAPFVSDQLDDLKAAFHAGCPRILVRTGLGRRALEDGLPHYAEPVAVHDDLAGAARSTPTFATCRGVAAFLQGHERASGRN